MMKQLLAAALLAAAVAANAFAAAPDCQTESAMRAGFVRDFPPGSKVAVTVAEVVRNLDGTLSVEGLAPAVRDFLARALARMNRYGDYKGGRVLMVGFRFAAPPRTIFSFVETDAASCVRPLDRLKIIIDPDGTVSTSVPHYPQP